jgi:transcriptional regulator with XRE-family HTH domain
MPTRQAGAYLKHLRESRALSTEALAEEVGVKRGTVERLEKGDDSVAIGTVTQVFEVVGASPGSYHLLATDPSASLTDVLHRHEIALGIASYLVALASYQRIPLETLADLMHAPIGSLHSVESNARPSTRLPDLSLLLGLLALDVPLTDVQAIVEADLEHDRIGRQMASQRASVAASTLAEPAVTGPPHSYPLIDSALRRLSLLQRNGQELPAVLRHELARAIRDLEQFQILLHALHTGSQWTR